MWRVPASECKKLDNHGTHGIFVSYENYDGYRIWIRGIRRIIRSTDVIFIPKPSPLPTIVANNLYKLKVTDSDDDDASQNFWTSITNSSTSPCGDFQGGPDTRTFRNIPKGSGINTGVGETSMSKDSDTMSNDQMSGRVQSGAGCSTLPCSKFQRRPS